MITSEQLHSCIPLASDRAIAKYYQPLCETIERFNINTSLRIAAFLAQIAHESGNLQYVEELASGSAYEYRKDLGNLEFEALQIAHANYSTTGKFYKGRGLIQITGFYNYKKCGEALGIDCIHIPQLLTDPMYASLSAGWFWDANELNAIADTGNFNKTTRIINGGWNGKNERLSYYRNNITVLV